MVTSSCIYPHATAPPGPRLCALSTSDRESARTRATRPNLVGFSSSEVLMLSPTRSQIEESFLTRTRSQIEAISLTLTARSQIEAISLTSTARSQIEAISLTSTARSQIEAISLTLTARSQMEAISLTRTRSQIEESFLTLTMRSPSGASVTAFCAARFLAASDGTSASAERAQPSSNRARACNRFSPRACEAERPHATTVTGRVEGSGLECLPTLPHACANTHPCTDAHAYTHAHGSTYPPA